MYNRRCTFAGHSKIEDTDTVREAILKYSESLIVKYNVEEFYVGNYGGFDRCAASAIKKLKEVYNVKLILVVPYMTKELIENKQYYSRTYDEICLATIPDTVPAKFRILYANRYMVDCCKFLIAYVSVGWGGAAKTLLYANKNDKCIINLAAKKE